MQKRLYFFSYTPKSLGTTLGFPPRSEIWISDDWKAGAGISFGIVVMIGGNAGDDISMVDQDNHLALDRGAMGCDIGTSHVTAAILAVGVPSPLGVQGPTPGQPARVKR